MKFCHAILVVALLCLSGVSFANTSEFSELICQFDKATMIKEKLKRAQECINNGNYTAAKNYLNGVLKLDPNNAKAKKLLAVCNNRGKTVTSSRANSSIYNSNNRGTSLNTGLSVSKSNLAFSSDGGTETITVSGSSWSISVSPDSWGHLKQEGNTLTLSVDANYTGNQRTDYFVLSAGGVDKRINITQSQTYAKNGVSMYGSTRAYTENASGLSYLTTCIKGWGKCRLGALTESGAGVAIYDVNGYATTGNLNKSFVAKIKELNSNKETFKSVTTTSSGFYCIVYGRNGWYGNVPNDMKLKLNQFNNNREDIYCVSIAENGDFVIITDKHMYASNATDKSNLNKASEKYGHIKYACVTNRALVVICHNGIFYSNIPTNLEVKLKSISFKPDKIAFTDSGTYLITNENESYYYNM